MEERVIIQQVVEDFYTKAIKDIFLAHHFRKIESSVAHDFLDPNLGSFKDHIPRIVHFWEVQLLRDKISGERFELLRVHQELGIRRGELGRWINLFNETLKDHKAKNPSFIELWEQKVQHFQAIFERSPIFISQSK
jgi:truncated hemoglobin YjbI